MTDFCSTQGDSDMKKIVSKYKIMYKNYTPVYSLALGEMVYFNMAGFKHLIFKRGHRRPNRVIYSRMVLVSLIKPVIHASENVIEVRTGVEIMKGLEVKVKYCALEARVGKSSTRVRVVVKKIGDNGKYYFQSIMKYD